MAQVSERVGGRLIADALLRVLRLESADGEGFRDRDAPLDADAVHAALDGASGTSMLAWKRSRSDDVDNEADATACGLTCATSFEQSASRPSIRGDAQAAQFLANLLFNVASGEAQTGWNERRALGCVAALERMSLRVDIGAPFLDALVGLARRKPTRAAVGTAARVAISRAARASRSAARTAARIDGEYRPTDSEFFVWSFIASRTGARPTFDEIADHEHMGKSTVKAAIAELESRGILTRAGKTHRGPWTLHQQPPKSLVPKRY